MLVLLPLFPAQMAKPVPAPVPRAVDRNAEALARMRVFSLWVDIDRWTEGSVRDRPFSARMDSLRAMAGRGSASGPDGRARLNEIATFWRRRGWWPEAGGLEHVELDPPGFAADSRTLFVRFLCYGESWPRARQTLAYERLGGAGGDRRIAVWYAMFPYVPGSGSGSGSGSVPGRTSGLAPSLAGIAAVGRIARRFPDRWEPRLVRYALARRLYERWAISGAPRGGAISPSLHRELRADVDAAYRITTAKFGADAPWHEGYKADLDLWRRRAGIRGR